MELPGYGKRPSWPYEGNKLQGWIPKAPEGMFQLERNLAEMSAYDALFPSHPLSLVRSKMFNLKKGLRLDSALEAFMPFPLPCPYTNPLKPYEAIQDRDSLFPKACQTFVGAMTYGESVVSGFEYHEQAKGGYPPLIFRNSIVEAIALGVLLAALEGLPRWMGLNAFSSTTTAGKPTLLVWAEVALRSPEQVIGVEAKAAASRFVDMSTRPKEFAVVTSTASLAAILHPDGSMHFDPYDDEPNHHPKGQ